ncbi:hypothetical protein QO206_02955 [Leeuwenhoekiella aequorea]|uniref:hypothetical protein n=1 Tax=Leeuwenhoekiella aequorea TaxID=283736 RepID=UPI00352EBA98
MMTLRDKFPNYSSALEFSISDKNPIKGSDDANQISYYIPLKNFKKGFDFYELNRSQFGIRFKVTTMLGLKTVVYTETVIITADKSYQEWIDIILKTTINHFNKEEYQALKKGYVKKSSNAGCLGLILLITVIICISLNY